jgi:hypothetical protein
MPVSPARARKGAANTFKGWFRPQGEQRWRVLCEADDYDTAWALLLDRLPHVNGDAVVLPGERVP